MFLPLQSQNQNAEIAQLVEHDLAKVGVASSSLVFRSKGFRIFRDPFSYMGSSVVFRSEASEKSEAFFVPVHLLFTIFAYCVYIFY